MTAVARHTDPETSHIAASLVRPQLSFRIQRAILDGLHGTLHLTDEQIFHRVQFILQHPVTPSGCRTRRAELVGLGLVAHLGYGRTSANRHCRRWCITERGRNILDALTSTETK